MTPSANDAGTRPAPPATDQFAPRRGGGNEADRAAAELTEARRAAVEDARRSAAPGLRLPSSP